MLDKKQLAIIKKDFKSITSSKRMMSAIVAMPIVMAVVIPVLFISIILFTPEDSSDMAELMQILPKNTSINDGGIRGMLIGIILNYVIPMFFLLIPIMASSVMASSSFVGEKEKKTLETLLYCPLPLKDIFSAKILASFFLSMLVSIFSFIMMIIVIQIFLLIAQGAFFGPGVNWLTMMLLVSPAAALISINLIVRGSAKSQTSEEAQQSSLFLILPVILLLIGQFTGIMMMGPIVFLVLGAVLAVIALFTLKSSYKKFNYEALLR